MFKLKCNNTLITYFVTRLNTAVGYKNNLPEKCGSNSYFTL